MKYEIVYKDAGEIVNVTIAAERTTLKIPKKFPKEVQDLLEQRVKSVESEIRKQFEGTMRGGFFGGFTRLILANVSRTKHARFDFEAIPGYSDIQEID